MPHNLVTVIKFLALHERFKIILKNLYSEELLTVNATQSSDRDQIPCSTGKIPDHLHLKNLYSEELMTVDTTQSSDSDQSPCSTGKVPYHLKKLYSEELMTVNATQSSDSD